MIRATHPMRAMENKRGQKIARKAMKVERGRNRRKGGQNTTKVVEKEVQRILSTLRGKSGKIK